MVGVIAEIKIKRLVLVDFMGVIAEKKINWVKLNKVQVMKEMRKRKNAKVFIFLFLCFDNFHLNFFFYVIEFRVFEILKNK